MTNPLLDEIVKPKHEPKSNRKPEHKPRADINGRYQRPLFEGGVRLFQCNVTKMVQPLTTHKEADTTHMLVFVPWLWLA